MLSRVRAWLLTCAFMLIGATSLVFPASAHSAPLDANVVSSYTPLTTSVMWHAWGKNSGQSGGNLGPFNRACAILEGAPSTNANVMTRSVYVLDAGNGNVNTVVLNVFTRTDTITTSGDTTNDAVTFALGQQVVLPLTSQAGAACYMAANDTSVFASTSANNIAAIVDKTTFSQSTVASYVALNNGPVTRITATDEGLVFVTFGTGPNAGFAQFDDQSNYLGVGQFFNFTVLANTVNATTF